MVGRKLLEEYHELSSSVIDFESIPNTLRLRTVCSLMNCAPIFASFQIVINCIKQAYGYINSAGIVRASSGRRLLRHPR